MGNYQSILDAFQDIYDKINFYGVYVKYGYCVKKLMGLLRLEDPAELHYVMIHLNRLSCINNEKGHYLWASKRYSELHGFADASPFSKRLDADLYDPVTVTELNAMKKTVFTSHGIATALTHAQLANHSDFSAHVKVYPVYNEEGQVIASLSVFTEVVSRHHARPTPHEFEDTRAKHTLSKPAEMVSTF